MFVIVQYHLGNDARVAQSEMKTVFFVVHSHDYTVRAFLQGIPMLYFNCTPNKHVYLKSSYLLEEHRNLAISQVIPNAVQLVALICRRRVFVLESRSGAAEEDAVNDESKDDDH